MATKGKKSRYRKGEKGKLITGRRLYKTIAKYTGVPFMDVQTVLESLGDVIREYVMRGYEVNLPPIGFFTYIEKTGHDKGEKFDFRTNGIVTQRMYEKQQRIGEEEYINEKCFRIIKNDDNTYSCEFMKDQPNRRRITFSFYKKYKQDLFEESVNYGGFER